jgi:hypothetical protein
MTNLLLALAIVFSALSCNRQETNQNQVMQGKFRQTITESGELVAVDVRSFVMPRFGRYWYNMKIIGLADHGTAVKPGDSLIQFDPADIKKFIIERETQLENERANLEKLVVQQENRISDLMSALRSEEASFNLKKLEMEQSRFESERIRQIRQLEFRQAEINFEKAKKRINLNNIIAANELKIQKIRVSQFEKEVKEAYAVLPTLTIRTPIPGIFQVANKRRSRELLRLGDEVSFGTNLGNVPDLTWMKVKSTISETDISKVKLGQKVHVRLDALPNVAFDGEISHISILCRKYENTRRKVFDVEVKLLVSDERLKPGMTVSCEIIANELENILYVPNSCLAVENSHGAVFLKKTVGFEKVQVKIEGRNNTHTAVSGNLRKGKPLFLLMNCLKLKTNNHAVRRKHKGSIKGPARP